MWDNLSDLHHEGYIESEAIRRQWQEVWDNLSNVHHEGYIESEALRRQWHELSVKQVNTRSVLNPQTYLCEKALK